MKAVDISTGGAAPAPEIERRLPVGAEIVDGGVDFRVWAPLRDRIELVIERGEGVEDVRPMLAEADGYHRVRVPGLHAGMLYRFRFGLDLKLFPDPASRFQPDGPHGPSMIVNPQRYRWKNAGWKWSSGGAQVIYEMHVGTFTSDGTWERAIAELRHLAGLGVTIIEVMPVADFVGRFGWGYDGANLFAPSRLYGAPDDMRAFVDAAHGLGMGVILDVVYNHFGADGNYLAEFSPDYFSKTHETDWGRGINFDGDNAEHVRAYYLANVRHWIREYRLDGLRLDATQDIVDSSEPHILAEIVSTARAAASGRDILVVGENEPQKTQLIRSREAGGFGIDMLWNDDFHHAAMVNLTGRAEAYYTDYRGSPQEFVSLAKRGFLYQGQRYRWQRNPRGTPTKGLRADQFINFLQNHDQVANSGRGERLGTLAGAGRVRAMTAVMMLSPGTPMLFQGQEFAASTPFFYFADQKPEIAELVAKGREEFLSQFASLATSEMRAQLPDPGDPATFERSALRHEERVAHAPVWRLHRDLIALRRKDPVLRPTKPDDVDGAVLAPEAFILRYFAPDGMDRILLVNFGADLRFEIIPEPLIAPPEGCRWRLYWSSEAPKYGGNGTPAAETKTGWKLPGRSALLFRAERNKPQR